MQVIGERDHHSIHIVALYHFIHIIRKKSELIVLRKLFGFVDIPRINTDQLVFRTLSLQRFGVKTGYKPRP